MRTLGKICAWGSAVGLALLAVGEFNGNATPNFWAGIFFALFAAESAADGFCYFKKPKRPYLKWTVTYQDGTQRAITMRADAQTVIPATPGNPIVDLAGFYFESDKDEASNEQTNNY